MRSNLTEGCEPDDRMPLRALFSRGDPRLRQVLPWVHRTTAFAHRVRTVPGFPDLPLEYEYDAILAAVPAVFTDRGPSVEPLAQLLQTTRSGELVRRGIANLEKIPFEID